MLPSVNEAQVLVLLKIENSSSKALDAPHGPHRVNNGRRPVTTKNRVDIADGETTALSRLELDSDHAVLSRDQTTSRQSGLVVPRDIGKGGAEGPLSITSFLLDECVCSLLKERQHVLVYFLEVLADVHSTGLDDVLGLWHTNSLQLDTSLLLDGLD